MQFTESQNKFSDIHMYCKRLAEVCVLPNICMYASM